MPPEQQQRRAPAEPKNIEEIEQQNDIRVRIMGTVLAKDQDAITIDDGTGSVEAFLDEDALEDIEENDRVRVFGRVLPTPDSFEIQGEIVQSLEGLDQDLYDRVKKVVSTSE